MSEAKELQKEREKIEENVAQFTKLVPKSLMYLFKNPEDFELHRIDILWEESVSKFSVNSMKMFLEFVLSMKPNTICQLVECFDYARDQTEKEAKTNKTKPQEAQDEDVFVGEVNESRLERRARRKRETLEKAAKKIMGTEEAKFNLQKKLEEFIDIAEKQEMYGAATNIAAGSKGFQLIDAIRAVKVKFGSKLSAACHIAKHPTDPISDYLVFANKVIRDQSGDNPSISQKGDANIVKFKNPNGKAFVREKHGEVLLMTYYPLHH